MRTDTDSAILPAAIVAARLRTPRHLRISRDRANNYVAESAVSNGKKRRNSKRPGAPLGNLNAFKHGARSAEARAFRARVHALVTAARRTLALRKLAVDIRGQGA